MPTDIAVNITDSQYLGEYNGRKKHQMDMPAVISRGISNNIKMVFLSISLSTAVESIFLAQKYHQYSTIGIHPNSPLEGYIEEIESIKDILQRRSIERYKSLIRPEILTIHSEREDKTVWDTSILIAIGECGLDYHRDHNQPKLQKQVFQAQLELSRIVNLPYIFHYRECSRDFLEITSEYKVQGVVHSFTGTPEEMKDLIRQGYYIGVNGASIRENITTQTIEEIPLNRLLIETDSPWCTIRNSSPYHKYTKNYLQETKRFSSFESGVKGRNEPANLQQVIDIVAKIKNTTAESIIQQTETNFQSLFQLSRDY
ncbi:TatD DNase family protein [Nematocida sp. AWRm80]|nr:TatD DNase family protein [Nematocida sp. AWRm80]